MNYQVDTQCKEICHALVNLAKEIALVKNMSPRNANRKISEYVEIGELFQDKEKNSSIKLSPWSKK